MEDKLKIVKEILSKYGQEHLIQFYAELTENQKSDLLNQILKINFEEILDLYEKSKLEVLNSTENIEPLSYSIKEDLSASQKKQFNSLGIKAIKSGKVGVITLAGGQGSRLGFNGPKGTFRLDIESKKSLFEILCDYLKYYSSKYKVNIPWYIMTSTDNYFDTISFFEQNQFFGYERNNVIFFVQDNMPIIDISGKLVLSEIYKVNLASNGNGNLFTSLKKANLIKDMEQRKLQWLFVGGIDNVLLDPLDPIFIGYTINSKCEIGSKTLFKEDPCNISWIFARRDSKPAIIDCENFTEEISKLKDKSGKYLYRETNMLAHIFSLKAVKKMANVVLPYHRAFRKNAFVNSEGMKEVPENPNIYKFEQFVFDAFSHFDNIALLRVDANKEFSPIKDFNSEYNPEIAAKKYEKFITKADL
jgi:UDP-N-acetylglucosamine/UDP-N-acetylgalactosamine diphosphorylase